METIIPATKNWRVCVDQGECFPPKFFAELDVVAWIVQPDGPPTPITCFGPVDTNREYVLAPPTQRKNCGYTVMPSGVILDSFNDALDWFKQRRRRAAA